jgi:hypothetical protein
MRLSAMYFAMLALAAGVRRRKPIFQETRHAPEPVQGFLAGLIQRLRRILVDK